MRDAGGDDGVVELLATADADAALVHERAPALLGEEHLVAHRVVDDAGERLRVALEGNGDGELRDAVQKVGGAVERIDQPAVRGVFTDADAVLLHDEAVLRPRLGQLGEDDLLGLAVGVGDEIGRAFDGNLQLLDLAKVAQKAARRLLGGIGHDIEERGAQGHGSIHG